jgi:outer membrane protein assembly factor BamB
LVHLVIVMVGVFAVPAADWPQFLGPNRNGAVNDTNVAKAWPKDGPPVVWQKGVGQGFAGPVVADGRLVLFHRADNQEIVECLNAETGQRFWSANYPATYKDDFGFDEGPRSTPTIHQQRVFTLGADGVFSCWALDSGKKLWTIDCRKEFGVGKGFFGIAGSPLVEGDTVLLNVGGKGASIVAFELQNGKVRWKAGNDEASYSSAVAATIGGKRYALFLTRKQFIGVDPSHGKLMFEFPWTPTIQASVSAAAPIVIGDKVFISASYGAGAALLQITDSGVKKIWAGDDILSNHYATSVHHRGFLYGFEGRQEYGSKLRCVEAATGKVKWTEEGLGAGTLMVVNDELLILSEKGELIRAAADPEKFKPTGRAQILPFGTRAHPALANSLYYARSKEKLVCVSLK